MNLSVWGKGVRAHSISELERTEREMEIEEIDISEEDQEDIPVLEADADQLDDEEDVEQGPDDNDWQEVYILNGCSTYFG
jgi:hypothetical protein